MPSIRTRVTVLTTLLLALVMLTAGAEPQAPVQSPNDSRDYRYIKLGNQLQVLLISDPDTDKAAAALDVGVGSGADPDERPGLAHFLEHMLFLGTEKYPRAGEYQEFIASHGGSHNAYTGFSDTNYFFDIDRDYLEPALDRFAQFFSAPLFSAEYVEREKNAVDSEFRLQLKNDAWRNLAAYKQVINPRHPLARFSVGSLETLSDREGQPVRSALLAFYQQHYSAGLMTLVVLGKEPLPQLQTWVEQKFSSIPLTDAQRQTIDEPLFEADRLPARLDIVPVKDKQSLRLTFPVPDPDPYYLQKPLTYLAHLLGHEGKGSVLSSLKEQGWAQGLAASPGRTMDDEATMEIRVDLTKSGLQHVDEIVATVFDYLALVGEKGVQNWIFDEQSRLAEIDFRFKEPSSAIGYVTSLAGRMQIYPAADLLRAPYAMEGFDPELIHRYLQRMVPGNVLVTVISRDLKIDDRAPWFDTPYRLSTIPEPTLARWRGDTVSPGLALPAANPFIPEDLALKAAEQTTSNPEIIDDRGGLRVWYKQDHQFKVPRADLEIAIRSRVVGESARNLVLTKLYASMVEDQLAEYSYPALLAGLDYHLSPATNGLSLTISGYSDRQDRLLKNILQALKNPLLDPARFGEIRQDLVRALDDVRLGKPYDQALAELPVLIMRPYWSTKQQQSALDDIGWSDLRAFIPSFLQKLEVEMLAHGNVSRMQTRELAALVEGLLLDEVQADTVPRPQVVALAPGELPVRELRVDSANAAVVIYYQGPQATIETRARFGMLGQILSTPFYQDLRTDKQLGYVVFASAMPLLEVPGLIFVVQSAVATADELEQNIDRFVNEYASAVSVMSDVEFDQNRQGLLTRLLEKPTRLSEQTARYWSDIRYRHPDFDTRDRLAEAVRKLTRADFEADYRDILQAEQPRRLAVRSYAGTVQTTAADGVLPREGETVIADTTVFKAGLTPVKIPAATQGD